LPPRFFVADVASGGRRVVVVAPVVGIAAGLDHVDQVLNGDPIGCKLVLVPRRIRHGHRLAAVKAQAFLVLVVEAVAVEEALKPDIDGFTGWGGHGDYSRKTGAMLMRLSRGSLRAGIGNGVGQPPHYHFAILKEAEAGLSPAQLCRGHGISDAKRLRAQEDENAKLKKLLAEQMMDVATLNELLAKNF
jgi:putative transposase